MSKILRIGLMMQGGLGWIGGTEYIKNLILALASLPAEVRSTFEICLICSKSFEPSLYESIHPYIDALYYKEEELKPFNLQNPMFWGLLKDFFFSQKQIDFVYPNVVSYIPFGQTYLSSGWFTDFQYKWMPELYTEKDIVNIDKLLLLIARRSPTIVLSSKTAETDFQKFFPEFAHKAEVLSFRTSADRSWYELDPQQTQREYSLPDRFFIVSNQFWQHKNHLVIFKALKLLQEKSIFPTIVFTGNIYDHRQPNYSNTILQTINKLGIARQVYLLGLIPRIDQIQLMRRSLAVIQPSLFEGWSTVLEDARCLGKQIVVSDIPIHLEQNPPNSLFFERNSPESLATILAELWESLTPGPVLDREATARTNNLAEVQAFGYRFLEIVRTSLLANRTRIRGFSSFNNHLVYKQSV